MPLPRTPAFLAVASLAALASLGACSRGTAADPGEALLDHLVALSEVVGDTGAGCEETLAAAKAYLDAHRAEIEALKAALVERTRALAPEERARQTDRFRDRAEERLGSAMMNLMDLGRRCPGQVSQLQEAMSFTDIRP
jgi:hypothetical protein